MKGRNTPTKSNKRLFKTMSKALQISGSSFKFIMKNWKENGARSGRPQILSDS